MKRPAVSVLFPVRDAYAFLPEAIASLEGQSFTDFEVLVVDDGSSDGSVALLEAWRDRDPRVRLLPGGQPERPMGVVGALESARASASGAYVARMDADDVTPLDRFARQVELLDGDSAIALCGIDIRYVPRDGVTGGARAYERWINRLSDAASIERDLFVECPVAHPTFMVRATALTAVGGYCDGPWPEDYDLLLRLWEAGARFAKAAGAPHEWRDHPHRLSRTDPRYAIESFQLLKCRVLGRTHLEGRDPVIWGAGPTGKAFARHLQRDGISTVAFVDLDPRRIGQTIHGAPVFAPDDLGPPRGRFALAAVSGKVPRGEIRAALTALGWRELDDFVAVA